MSQFITDNINEALKVKTHFLSVDKNIEIISASITQMIKSLNDGGKIISCGNGGSMCDAMHFAEELTGRFRNERPALPAMAVSDPSHITCVANDYGFEYIFSKYVEAHGKTGDILLAISTSGNSPNIIEAVKSAKQKGMKVIGLLGKTGGKLKGIVDFPLIIESSTSDRVQEMHILLIHTFIEGIERSIFPENYKS